MPRIWTRPASLPYSDANSSFVITLAVSAEAPSPRESGSRMVRIPRPRAADMATAEPVRPCKSSSTRVPSSGASIGSMLETCWDICTDCCCCANDSGWPLINCIVPPNTCCSCRASMRAALLTTACCWLYICIASSWSYALCSGKNCIGIMPERAASCEDRNRPATCINGLPGVLNMPRNCGPGFRPYNGA